MKLTSRLVSDGWVEQKIPGYRYHFQVFQLELDTLGTKNFGIGSVGAKLQPLLQKVESHRGYQLGGTNLVILIGGTN